jgi:translation initiation factor IF-1
MLAKLTSKNQLTLPKAATEAVGATEYFEIETRDGAIVLTPVRIQRGDAVRVKLAQLALSEADIGAAVEWARTRVAEPRVGYTEKKPTGRTVGKSVKRKP